MRFRDSAFLLVLASTPAAAQAPSSSAQLVVAVPPLPTPRNVDTEGGQTGVIGIQIAQTIASDLRSSNSIMSIAPDKLPVYSPVQAGAPVYQNWLRTGAGAVVVGYVQARDDGRITVACYLYDIKQRREMSRKGFVVPPGEWRRAAHRCADAFHAGITGMPGHYDTRIAYVAETGTRTAPVKRVAVVNWDGTDHRYLTRGETTVLSPRISPDGERIAYMSFTGGTPHIRVMDSDGENDRPLVQAIGMSFAPAFSPDGRRIAFSLAAEGNTDIFVMNSNGGMPQRLTRTPGVDTAPSFSPDGSKIVFESDRGGIPQLYLMNADGSGQQRISFGGGSYGSPVWSPKGDLIAFTRWSGSALRIGVMSPDGSGERAITSGWQDEGPSWAPDGEFLVFQRTQQGSGLSAVYTVSTAGGEPHRVLLPGSGSDPSWSGASQ